MIIVYRVVHRASGRCYIGQTNKTLEARRREHEWNAIHDKGFVFAKALKKYGFDAFDWTIITDCQTREEADNVEQQQIAEHKTTNRQFGFNLTLGGVSNFPVTRTVKHRKNIGLSHRGKVLSEATKEKIRQKLTGFKHTLEARQKMSESRKGSKNSFFGKKHSEATRKRISDARKRNALSK